MKIRPYLEREKNTTLDRENIYNLMVRIIPDNKEEEKRLVSAYQNRPLDQLFYIHSIINELINDLEKDGNI